jgi:UPF0176 protein
VSLRLASFYRFVPFAAAELPELRQRLQALGEKGGLKGTLLLAEEGINGSICGARREIEAFLETLRTDPRLEQLAVKTSRTREGAFHRLKVRIKREIVTMGRPEVRPAERVGTYVPPARWDALIRDPATLVIDTRNGYEVAVGSFEGAIDPGIASFRDFPAWVRRRLAPLMEERGAVQLALFCTGGIRCEKATSYLLDQGFEAVHHLEGGILRYLEQMPEGESAWRGECFVFDQRVAVGHDLAPGSHTLCHSCRMPLSPQDRLLPSYVEGVSCRHCHGQRSWAAQERLMERQKQVALARRRGEEHIGRRFGVRADRKPGGGADSPSDEASPPPVA